MPVLPEPKSREADSIARTQCPVCAGGVGCLQPEPPSANFVIIVPKPTALVQEAGKVPPDWKADG